MSKNHRIDRKAAWCVHASVKAFSPLILGSALLLGAGACGGKDKKATTPTSSSGTVSAGTPLGPGQDPANMDPILGSTDVASVPTADPNDRPPDRNDGGGDVAGNDAQLPPELKPPGLDMSPAERDAQVKKHLSSATAAIQNNADPDRTISDAQKALLVDETSIEAMVLLARGNVVKGYYDLAEDILLKAFQRGGKSNKQAFFLLGLVYENTDRPEMAPVAYQNALTLDPNYKSALMNLGVSRLGAKRYKEAVEIFERLTSSLGMNNAAVWTNLGSAYRGHSVDFQLTDITMRNTLVLKAEESYKRAISVDKNYANAYYNLGLLYLDADPYPTKSGDMDKIARLKSAKTYLDEYRRLPNTDQKLVDTTSAVTQKLLDKEELLLQKQAEREAKKAAAAAKQAERDAKKAAQPASTDDDDGFE